MEVNKTYDWYKFFESCNLNTPYMVKLTNVPKDLQLFERNKKYICKESHISPTDSWLIECTEFIDSLEKFLGNELMQLAIQEYVNEDKIDFLEDNNTYYYFVNSYDPIEVNMEVFNDFINNYEPITKKYKMKDNEDVKEFTKKLYKAFVKELSKAAPQATFVLDGDTLDIYVDEHGKVHEIKDGKEYKLTFLSKDSEQICLSLDDKLGVFYEEDLSDIEFTLLD